MLLSHFIPEPIQLRTRASLIHLGIQVAPGGQYYEDHANLFFTKWRGSLDWFLAFGHGVPCRWFKAHRIHHYGDQQVQRDRRGSLFWPLTSLHIEGNTQDGPLWVQIVKLPGRGALALQATDWGTAISDKQIGFRAEWITNSQNTRCWRDHNAQYWYGGSDHSEGNAR